MSTSRTYLGALAITGSLLSGAPILLGASLENPTFHQGDSIQATSGISLTNSTYLLASSDSREGPRDKEIVQENNTGSGDNQTSMEPATSYITPVMGNDRERVREGNK